VRALPRRTLHGRPPDGCAAPHLADATELDGKPVVLKMLKAEQRTNPTAAADLQSEMNLMTTMRCACRHTPVATLRLHARSSSAPLPCLPTRLPPSRPPACRRCSCGTLASPKFVRLRALRRSHRHVLGAIATGKHEGLPFLVLEKLDAVS
jgi:hypothetical protein